MVEEKPQQNKQVLIVMVMAVGLVGFLFFKMMSGSKGPQGTGDIGEIVPKAQDLESSEVGYAPEGIKDPFKLPRDMFKSSDEENPDLFEEDVPKRVVELPPMTIKGVILSDRPTVIIDDKIVKQGEAVYDATVTGISKEKIMFKYRGEDFELSTPIMGTEGFGSIPELPPQETNEVNINGNVIFKEYRDGPIVVIARMASMEDRKVILPSPGLFKINVPADSGNIYLSAMNIQENKSLAQLPFGSYSKNPVNAGKEDIGPVEIVMKEAQVKEKELEDTQR